MAVKKLPEQAQAFQLDSKLASQLGRKVGKANARTRKRPTADQCRARSDEHLAKAMVASDHRERADLLGVADRWARLAVDLESLQEITPVKPTARAE